MKHSCLQAHRCPFLSAHHSSWKQLLHPTTRLLLDTKEVIPRYNVHYSLLMEYDLLILKFLKQRVTFFNFIFHFFYNFFYFIFTALIFRDCFYCLLYFVKCPFQFFYFISLKQRYTQTCI